jgi:hypothetical protein
MSFANIINLSKVANLGYSCTLSVKDVSKTIPRCLEASTSAITIP